MRFAARDPGGANPLSSFLSQSDGYGWSSDIWTMPVATPVFERINRPTREFVEPVTIEDLRQAWTKDPANIIVTGTSHYSPFEQHLWEIARSQACPSLAILDQWINIPARFSYDKPDYVGAIDSWQAEELQHVGFDSTQIIVTGHPWLAQVMQQRCQMVEPVLSNSDPNAIKILFVNEPISSDISAGYAESPGYNEYDSFELVFLAAAQVASQGQPVSLAAK